MSIKLRAICVFKAFKSIKKEDHLTNKCHVDIQRIQKESMGLSH